jgi:hypothetical protein
MDVIAGSSPRKLVKRINLNNPTLISHSISTLFNPEYLIGTEEKSRMKREFCDNYSPASKPMPRSRSTMIFNHDSLNEAENEFILKKYESPKYLGGDLSPFKRQEKM